MVVLTLLFITDNVPFCVTNIKIVVCAVRGQLLLLFGFQSHRNIKGQIVTSSFYLWRETQNVRISGYSYVWVEPPTHHRTTGRPPHMKFSAPTGTRTHTIRPQVPRQIVSHVVSCLDVKVHNDQRFVFIVTAVKEFILIF